MTCLSWQLLRSKSFHAARQVVKKDRIILDLPHQLVPNENVPDDSRRQPKSSVAVKRLLRCDIRERQVKPCAPLFKYLWGNLQYNCVCRSCIQTHIKGGPRRLRLACPGEGRPWDITVHDMNTAIRQTIGANLTRSCRAWLLQLLSSVENSENGIAQCTGPATLTVLMTPG